VTTKHYWDVTSLHMRKLHGHKENTAAVLLAVGVLRELPGIGFTCHNTVHAICKAVIVYYVSMLVIFTNYPPEVNMMNT
jgi:hypothetical protein